MGRREGPWVEGDKVGIYDGKSVGGIVAIFDGKSERDTVGISDGLTL